MADESIQPANDNERSELVREQLANTKITLSPIDKSVDLTRAKKIPLGQIASVGTAFASMPAAFRSVTQTVITPGGSTLVQVLAADGSPLDISMLQKFKDGSGFLGSTRFNGTFQQARLVQAGPQTLTSVTTIPYDPTTLAMAIALQQVNQKLDNIQKTVDEMYDYMRQRDKSKMRGNLKALTEYLNEYQHDWDNARSMDSVHGQVLGIKREAQQDMDFYSGQVEKKLADRAPLEVRGMIEARLDGVLDALKDYQLATYIYAFAAFLDPMLAENFKAERLADVANCIEKASVHYREMYTRVYNELEGATTGSVDSAVLGGLAAAGKFLGKAVASTPVGDHTLIDEALEDGGRAVEKFNRGANSRLLKKLRAAKSPDIAPFRESVLCVDALYNRPSRMLTDGESLYVLPVEATAIE